MFCLTYIYLPVSALKRGVKIEQYPLIYLL